ncbi:hypothetical protein C8R44DRAFT_734399 [Mycena epipterygia]|nr:hypothetical protein C8R44DRAFT_734399 [Mycena epipterygia]
MFALPDFKIRQESVIKARRGSKTVFRAMAVSSDPFPPKPDIPDLNGKLRPPRALSLYSSAGAPELVRGLQRLLKHNSNVYIAGHSRAKYERNSNLLQRSPVARLTDDGYDAQFGTNILDKPRLMCGLEKNLVRWRNKGGQPELRCALYGVPGF